MVYYRSLGSGEFAVSRSLFRWVLVDVIFRYSFCFRCYFDEFEVSSIAIAHLTSSSPQHTTELTNGVTSNEFHSLFNGQLDGLDTLDPTTGIHSAVADPQLTTNPPMDRQVIADHCNMIVRSH